MTSYLVYRIPTIYYSQLGVSSKHSVEDRLSSKSRKLGNSPYSALTLIKGDVRMPRPRSNTDSLRAIPTDSRTKGEMFQAWKRTNPNTDWRTHWDEQLKGCVDLFEKYGFKLLCIARNRKIPVKGVRWHERDLSYDNALILLRKGMNIAVNLKKSGLIIADCDDRNIPSNLMPYFYRTISVVSPHGYHLYFRYDTEADDETLHELCNAFDKPNLFRGGKNRPQYVLVPLSCVDGKHYEFINASSLMDFSEFIEEVM